MKKIIVFYLLIFQWNVFNAQDISIVIDPGHGYLLQNELPIGVNCGSALEFPVNSGIMRCSPGGKCIDEIENVLAIGLRIRDKLEQNCNNVLVHMTRTSNTQWIKIDERAKMVDDNNAELFLSLHTNACPSCAFPDACGEDYQSNGIESYYTTSSNPTYQDCIAFGQNIDAAIDNVTGMGIRSGSPKNSNNNYGVLRYGNARYSILSEIGFHTNASNLSILDDPFYQEEIAQAMYEAILETLPELACCEGVSSPCVDDQYEGEDDDEAYAGYWFNGVGNPYDSQVENGSAERVLCPSDEDWVRLPVTHSGTFSLLIAGNTEPMELVVYDDLLDSNDPVYTEIVYPNTSHSAFYDIDFTQYVTCPIIDVGLRSISPCNDAYIPYTLSVSWQPSDNIFKSLPQESVSDLVITSSQSNPVASGAQMALSVSGGSGNYQWQMDDGYSTILCSGYDCNTINIVSNSTTRYGVYDLDEGMCSIVTYEVVVEPLASGYPDYVSFIAQIRDETTGEVLDLLSPSITVGHTMGVTLVTRNIGNNHAMYHSEVFLFQETNQPTGFLRYITGLEYSQGISMGGYELHQLSFEISGGEEGINYLEVLTDPYNTIDEGVDGGNNNFLVIPFTLTTDDEVPDLQMRIMSAVPDNNLALGDSLTINYRVSNHSDADVGQVGIRGWLAYIDEFYNSWKIRLSDMEYREIGPDEFIYGDMRVALDNQMFTGGGDAGFIYTPGSYYVLMAVNDDLSSCIENDLTNNFDSEAIEIVDLSCYESLMWRWWPVDTVPWYEHDIGYLGVNVPNGCSYVLDINDEDVITAPLSGSIGIGPDTYIVSIAENMTNNYRTACIEIDNSSAELCVVQEPQLYLPLAWEDVYVVTHDRYDEIVWEIAQEEDIARYVVERRLDAGGNESYEDIAEYRSRAEDSGAIAYRHDSYAIQNGNTLYRIRAEESDGSIMYSPWVSSTRGDEFIGGECIQNFYVSQEAIHVHAQGDVVMSIFDTQARKVYHGTYHEGYHEESTHHLVPGMYFIHMRCVDGQGFMTQKYIRN